jgi:hypothetical protein
VDVQVESSRGSGGVVADERSGMTWLLDERWCPVPVWAARPGSVRDVDDGEGVPEVVPVVGRSPDGVSDDVVRGWLTAERVAAPHETWRHWAGRFDRSGLWPLLVGTAADRPFLSGELLLPAPPSDAASVLRSGWEGMRRVRSDGTLLPHPPWPGLAAGTAEQSPDRVVFPRLSGHGRRGRLLLVPASRPADSLAQLGWHGACNWFLTGADVAGVLRSWEVRFGAYVVAVGFATLDLVVTRPPVDVGEALVLAQEHVAFCPDVLDLQDLPPSAPLTVPDLAQQLWRSRTWHFWWD